MFRKSCWLWPEPPPAELSLEATGHSNTWDYSASPYCRNVQHVLLIVNQRSGTCPQYLKITTRLHSLKARKAQTCFSFVRVHLEVVSFQAFGMFNLTVHVGFIFTCRKLIIIIYFPICSKQYPYLKVCVGEVVECNSGRILQTMWWTVRQNPQTNLKERKWKEKREEKD